MDTETLLDLERTLLDLERAGWESLCNGTGGEFYGRILTTDGLMVLANGQVMSRRDVVAALTAAPSWDSYDIDDPRVVPITPDAAALVYTGTGRREGGAPPFVGAMTSVYVRSGDNWKLALYQQTPVAAD